METIQDEEKMFSHCCLRMKLAVSQSTHRTHRS